MSIRIKKGNWYNQLVSISVFLYFLSLLYLFIGETSLSRTIFYQITSILCIAEFLLDMALRMKRQVNPTILAFITVCLITGFFNHFIIRNVSLSNIIECSLYNTIIACLIIEKRIDRKWFEATIYLYVLIFAYRIIQYGMFVRITRFSNNQVSVTLLLPAIMYYVMSDIRKEQIKILPAIATWVIALLSRGRSGIVTFTALFVVVFLSYNKDSLVGSESKGKTAFKVLGRLLLIIAEIFLIYYFYSQYSDLVFAKFIERGTDNSARLIIWGEYLEEMSRNIKYLILGTPKSGLLIGKMFANNTHNSFISIHADNGIIMLLFVLGLLFKAGKYAIKNKYFLYFSCIIIFCFRSFFDNVFWGTWGTTIFIYLLFLPLLEDKWKPQTEVTNI